MNPQKRWMLAAAAAAMVLFLGAGALAAEEDRVRLEIVVTNSSDEPVRNASVYVRYKQPRTFRRDKTVSLTVKTNPDGKAVVPEVPEGRVMVQVVAPGWKTYGEHHKIEGPKATIEVKLERPPKWY